MCFVLTVSEFIEPGTLQHIGENFLSLTKFLSTSTLEDYNTTESVIYFDYLSFFMISVPKEAAISYGWTYIVIGSVSFFTSHFFKFCPRISFCL
jgi:hypothetical protein